MITRRAFLTGLTATTALVAVPGAAVALPRITVEWLGWYDDFDPGPYTGLGEPMPRAKPMHEWVRLDVTAA